MGDGKAENAGLAMGPQSAGRANAAPVNAEAVPATPLTNPLRPTGADAASGQGPNSPGQTNGPGAQNGVAPGSDNNGPEGGRWWGTGNGPGGGPGLGPDATTSCPPDQVPGYPGAGAPTGGPNVPGNTLQPGQQTGRPIPGHSE